MGEFVLTKEHLDGLAIEAEMMPEQTREFVLALIAAARRDLERVMCVECCYYSSKGGCDTAMVAGASPDSFSCSLSERKEGRDD